jgi:hypothetical protein
MLSSTGSETRSTTVHGLRLQTSFVIWPETTKATREHSHEVNVNLVPDALEECPMRGEIVADSVENGVRLYTFARTGSCTEFWFPDLCRGSFDIDRGLVQLGARDLSYAALVLPNTIVAAYVSQLGDLALHASAIRCAERTVAFCGPSTAGKTTCAAALSLLGAAVVTDDLLRVSTSGTNTMRCFPGVPEFRLRTTHDWIFPPGSVRTLPDARIGFTPNHIWHDRTTLEVIVFPVAHDEPVAPQLRRVRGEVAVRRLLQSSRIAWAPSAGAHYLRQLVLLAAKVECFELDIHLGSLKEARYREQLLQSVATAAEKPNLP